jgi:SNF2 family DNA or RNA helicase
MSIISEIQIEGFCKKVAKKDFYRYPETPASIYRLARTGDDQWGDYPDLKLEWDDQMRAVNIVRDLVQSPGGLPEDLWKHQALALHWASAIHSGLLWAHMGTGKTRIILELINGDPTIKKVLVVCPIVVIDAWLDR